MNNPEIKLEKVYRKGGGAYTTKVNGLEVEVMQTNGKYKWTAFSWCGTIDIQAERLKSIVTMLEQWDIQLREEA